MSDLINGRTPKDLKDALMRCGRRHCKAENGDCPYYIDCLGGATRLKLMKDAFDYIRYLESERDAALAKVPRWISVEERLPELPDRDYCYVIVNTFLKGNENSAPMEYERAIIRGKREERWRWISGNLAYTPDYWMPLPEPPKEKTT